MPALLVLAFVVVPLLELVAIIQVGQLIGTGWTIAILVIDSIVGAILLKRESRRAWHDFRTALSAGRWPGDEVTQGALVIVGGALLLTPGFITDVVGLLALLPPSRALGSRFLRSRVLPGAVFSGTVGRGGPARSADGARGRRPGPAPTGQRSQDHHGPQVLDVEVLGVEREPRPDPPASDDRRPPPA